MLIVLGNQCSTKRSIANWFSRFRSEEQSLKVQLLSGRPKKAVTLENIHHIKGIIEEDPRSIYEIIQEELNIRSSASNIVLKDYLQLNKIWTRLVRHILKKKHNNQRLYFYKNMVDKYDDLDRRLIDEIITGDETWIYYYDPENPHQSKE